MRKKNTKFLTLKKQIFMINTILKKTLTISFISIVTLASCSDQETTDLEEAENATSLPETSDKRSSTDCSIIPYDSFTNNEDISFVLDNSKIQTSWESDQKIGDLDMKLDVSTICQETFYYADTDTEGRSRLILKSTGEDSSRTELRADQEFEWDGDDKKLYLQAALSNIVCEDERKGATVAQIHHNSGKDAKPLIRVEIVLIDGDEWFQATRRDDPYGSADDTSYEKIPLARYHSGNIYDITLETRNGEGRATVSNTSKSGDDDEGEYHFDLPSDWDDDDENFYFKVGIYQQTECDEDAYNPKIAIYDMKYTY